VYLPQDAQNVSYSSDGDYISYMENGSIQVVDLDSGEENTVAASVNMSISYYKWVGDRDRLILAEKADSNRYFKLYYYDVINNNTVEIANGLTQSNIMIDANGKSDAVTDIQMSTLTNLIYIKMTNSNQISHFYEINIMAQGDSIYLPYYHVGAINLLNDDDKLLYENLDNNKIYLYGRSTAFTIDNKKYFKILGSDDNDVIYLAEYDASSNQTSNIYYGNDTQGWIMSSFNKPTNINDIFISESGQIYIDDSADSVLYNILTNSQTRYVGKFIGIYSGGIISQNDSLIVRTNFPK
jgi:hypothetical protein